MSKLFFRLPNINICRLFAAVSRGGRESAVLAPARRLHSVLPGGCRQHSTATSGRADSRREATPGAGLQGSPRYSPGLLSCLLAT